MYENVLTSRFIERGRLPIIEENCGRAFSSAVRILQDVPPETAKVMRIRNTLDLSSVYVSASLLPAVALRPYTMPSPQPVEMFDQRGELIPF